MGSVGFRAGLGKCGIWVVHSKNIDGINRAWDWFGNLGKLQNVDDLVKKYQRDW